MTHHVSWVFSIVGIRRWQIPNFYHYCQNLTMADFWLVGICWLAIIIIIFIMNGLNIWRQQSRPSGAQAYYGESIASIQARRPYTICVRVFLFVYVFIFECICKEQNLSLESFSESKYLPHPPDVKFYSVPLKGGLPANELDNQKSAAFSHLRKQGSLKVICESCFNLKKLIFKKTTTPFYEKKKKNHLLWTKFI